MMGLRSLILALALSAAFGLQVKSEASYGLDMSLDGLPQKMAKVFMLAIKAKATPEMIDDELEEIFEKQRRLPKDKQLRLAKAVQDMFPQDLLETEDLEELMDWKSTRSARSLLQTQDPTDVLDEEGGSWHAWSDDYLLPGWRKAPPSMRGPHDYKNKLERNLRLSEAEVARDNCIPDGILSCYTKDWTYLPCRTFNFCMGFVKSQALDKPLYAYRESEIPRALKSGEQAQDIMGRGLMACHAANALTAPETLEPLSTLLEDAENGGTELSERLPCSVAFSKDSHLYKLGAGVAKMEMDKRFNPEQPTGAAAKKTNRERLKLREALSFEAGAEAGRVLRGTSGTSFEEFPQMNGGRPRPINTDDWSQYGNPNANAADSNDSR